MALAVSKALDVLLAALFAVVAFFVVGAALASRRPPPGSMDAGAAQFVNLFATGARSGARGAPVRIVVHSGYGCAACQVHDATMRTTLSKYPQFVSISRHIVPRNLVGSRDSFALGAICLSDSPRLVDYHEQASGRSLTTSSSNEVFEVLEAVLGSTLARQIVSCIGSVDAAKVGEGARKSAADLGVIDLPVTFINGERVSGSMKAAALDSIIARLLRRKFPDVP